MNNRKKALLLLIMAAVLWGYSFISTSKLVNGGVSNDVVIVGRYLIGAIAIFVMGAQKILKSSKHDVFAGVVIGIVLFFAMYTQNASMIYTSVSKAAFISSLNIILVPFFAYFVLKSKITKKNVIGLLIAVVGTVLLSFDPKNFTNVNFGDMLALVSAVALATQVIVLSKYGQNASAFGLAFFEMVTVAACGLVMFFVNGSNLDNAFNPDMIKSFLYLGIAASGICYVCLSWSSKYVDEVLLSVIPSSQSLFAVVFDVLLLGTKLDFAALLGIIIMSIAVVYFAIASDNGKVYIRKLIKKEKKYYNE